GPGAAPPASRPGTRSGGAGSRGLDPGGGGVAGELAVRPEGRARLELATLGAELPARDDAPLARAGRPEDAGGKPAEEQRPAASEVARVRARAVERAPDELRRRGVRA